MKIRLGKLGSGLVLILLSISLFLPTYLQAGNYAGNTSFDFLSLSIGARQMAMGGSGAAIADDLFSSNINPAALGRLWRQEVSFLHTQWLEDTSFNYLGYAYPSPSHWGTLGASLYQLNYGDFQGYDANGVKTSILRAQDRMIQFSYGHSLSEHVSIGVNAKWMQEILDSTKAGAFAGDMGLLYRPSLAAWLPPTSVGLAIRNMGTRPKFISESASLPKTIQAGAAVRPFFQGLTLSLDATKVQSSNVSLQSGVEYLARDVVAFRAGYNSAYDIGTGFSLGAGVKAWDFQVDYAFAALSTLGITHHVGLTYRFGSLSETHYERGMKSLRQKDYARAIVEFGRALSIDQQNRRALLRLNEANEQLQRQIKMLKP